jgi:regulator of sigma E protease
LSSILSVVSAVFWGILVLSVLVFVHEGGHYLAARAFHVRVTEFFLGMPCRVRLSHKSERYGTEVGVTPILLGGYTRICGMEGDDDPLLAPALGSVMRRGRASAEEVADDIGCTPDEAVGLLDTLCDWASIRQDQGPAGLGGKERDELPLVYETLRRDANLLTEYDRGHDFSSGNVTEAGAPRESDVSDEELLVRERSHTYLGTGFWKRFAMLAAGPLVNLVLAVLIIMVGLSIQGVEVAVNSSQLGGVTDGSYAQAAGLEAGDVITSIDGTSISTWDDLVSGIGTYLGSGTDFTLTYERDGTERTTTVDLPDGQAVSLFGISASTTTYHPTIVESAEYAWSYAVLYASYVVRLIVPTQTMGVLSQSSSIVGISVMASEAASAGALELVLFCAVISMSLGFMNLLPIPPLDGGKILVEVIQVLMRRQLSMRVQTIVGYAGLAFFVFVFVVVLRNDIVRFVIG